MVQARDETKFTCGNVGEVNAWKIYVDLEKKLAGFVDWNTLSVLKLKTYRVMDILPPETIFTFKGKDKSHKGQNLQISFNRTRLKASVTFKYGQDDSALYQALDDCIPDSHIELSLEN